MRHGWFWQQVVRNSASRRNTGAEFCVQNQGFNNEQGRQEVGRQMEAVSETHEIIVFVLFDCHYARAGGRLTVENEAARVPVHDFPNQNVPFRQ